MCARPPIRCLRTASLWRRVRLASLGCARRERRSGVFRWRSRTGPREGGNRRLGRHLSTAPHLLREPSPVPALVWAGASGQTSAQAHSLSPMVHLPTLALVVESDVATIFVNCPPISAS